MTRSIERLARFLAISRRHLIDGVMPARRVPRRAAGAADIHELASDPMLADLDGWARAAAWPRLAPVAPVGAPASGPPAERRRRHSNEKRPSATSFASG